MNRKNIKHSSNKFVKAINILIVIAFIIVFIFMGRIALFKQVAGEDLIEFQANRELVDEILYATRGSIYDINGVPIAQTIPTYNMFAILDESISRSQIPEDGEPMLHVVDPQLTVEKLAPIIEMPKDEMLELLTRDEQYQVELSVYGNGIRQSKKDEIDALELPGIYFRPQPSRYYPQEVFASHLVGYASYNQDSNHVEGRMGIEEKLEQYLIGKDGKIRYQTNGHKQRIPSAADFEEAAIDGNDVTLTIDATIQRRLEAVMKQVVAEHNPQWGIVVIAEPKTGAILGVAQVPTFNPNELAIDSFMNLFVESEYEVGSVMKTITYASAIDAGHYDGNKQIQTGSVWLDDWQIHDWNRSGWGVIPTDRGLCYSANTAISDIVQTTMSLEEQKEYLKRFGFGQYTGVEIAGEATGTFVLNSTSERVTTGYGQGTTATVAQMVQSYNAIANGGEMMQLHIVDNIKNANNELVYKYEPTSIGKPISTATANHVMDLLVETINDDTCSSGGAYKMDNVTFAGKTGTANVADTENGGYLPSTDANYTYSFAGIAPAEDPQFLIYSSISLPENPFNVTRTVINNLTEDISAYLNVRNNRSNNIQPALNEGVPSISVVEVFPTFINRRREDALEFLQFAQDKIVFIGDGEYIVSQSIEPYKKYQSTQKVFFLTNSSTISIADFTGWSRKDIEIYARMTNLTVEFHGEGYAVEQSLPPGEIITDDNRVISVSLML